MTTEDKIIYTIAATVVLAVVATLLWVAYIMYFEPSVEISRKPVLTATAAPTRPPEPTATPAPTKAVSTYKPVKATPTPVPPTPTPKAAPATPTPVPPSPTLAPTLTLEEQLVQSLHEPWAAKDWEKVIGIIEQILAISPGYDDMVQKLYAAHVNYGRDLAAEGRLEEAKMEFIRALHVKPNGGETLVELAALAGETPRPLPDLLPVEVTPTPKPPEAIPTLGPPTTTLIPPTDTPLPPTDTPLRPTDTPVPTPMPPPKSAFEILSHVGYEDTIGFLHVVGEIRNNADATGEFIEIVGTFYDEAGGVVGTSFTYTTIDLVPAGGKSPFEIVSEKPQGYHHYKLQVSDQRTSELPLAGLQILSHSSSADSIGFLHIVGEVQNNSGKDVEFVKIIATLYNAAGQVIGTGFTYTASDIIAIGQTSPFEIIFDRHEGMATYELQVEGEEL
jgi:hypothetical protein